MSNIDKEKESLTLRDCAEGSAVLSALWHDFLENRLPHAVLLTGEAGIGKKTFARLLAQALLCNEGKQDKPCGQCRECRRFLARTHPDALFPAPAPREKTIKIDSLREMIDTLSRHSLEGGKRVIVLENAEKMTPQAQNCLLKTLEEAAEGTFFLLTADMESAVLPTIRSRCRVIRVQPWPEERVEKALLKRGVPPERAHPLSIYCEGSLGRALQMQEDESYWAARELVMKTFLNVSRTSDLASAAMLLKDQKDNGDRLLNILEQETRALIHARVEHNLNAAEDFPPLWQNARMDGLRRIIESVFIARKQRAANVGWAAVAENLMQKIAEEARTWQV